MVRKKYERPELMIVEGGVELILVKPYEKGSVYFTGYNENGFACYHSKKSEALVFKDDKQADQFATLHSLVIRVLR